MLTSNKSTFLPYNAGERNVGQGSSPPAMASEETVPSNGILTSFSAMASSSFFSFQAFPFQVPQFAWSTFKSPKLQP